MGFPYDGAYWLISWHSWSFDSLELCMVATHELTCGNVGYCITLEFILRGADMCKCLGVTQYLTEGWNSVASLNRSRIIIWKALLMKADENMHLAWRQSVQFQMRHISCRSKHIQRGKHTKNSGLATKLRIDKLHVDVTTVKDLLPPMPPHIHNCYHV